MPLYETAPYEIVEKDGRFEIRAYPPLLTAAVEEADWIHTRGFSAIFDYISGNNAKKEKISMTTPVLNDLSPSATTTEFVMPKKYSVQNLPNPANPSVRIRQIEGQLVASYTFSGKVTPKKLEAFQKQLEAFALKKGYQPTSLLRLARYNPPFVPAPLRRNDLLMRLEETEDTKG